MTPNADYFGRQVLGLVYNEKNKIRPEKISPWNCVFASLIIFLRFSRFIWYCTFIIYTFVYYITLYYITDDFNIYDVIYYYFIEFSKKKDH